MSDGLPPPPPQGGQPQAVGPYGVTSAQLTPTRPLTGLANALTVLLVLAAIVEIAAAVTLFDRAGLLDDAANGIFPTVDEATSADDRVGIALTLHLIAFLATGVVFIIWQYRHAKNAELLGVRGGGLGPGWAIGGWFIPFANYVLPGMQLYQSSRGSDVEGRASGGRGRGSGVVILWAVLFGLASIALLGSGGFSTGDDTAFTSVEDVEDAASDDRSTATGMLLYATAAVAAIAMVRSLTAKQNVAAAASSAATARAVATHFGTPPPPAPPPPPPPPPPLPPPPPQ